MADIPRRRLLLLRHGRTAYNATARAQGQNDIPLDEVGRSQAAAVAPHLASLGPVAVWASDLERARETAAYLERATGLSAKPDARLREYDVGEREGMYLTEFQRRWPAAYRAWMQHQDGPLVPGAESTAQVCERITPALWEMLSSLGPGELGVAVSHGAALKVGMIQLLGWPGALATQVRGMDNCAWASLEQLWTVPGERPAPASAEEAADHVTEAPAGPIRLVGYNQRADFASRPAVD